MKLIITFQKTALHFAIEKGNFEIIEALLDCERLDANLPSISNICSYVIYNQQFKYNYKHSSLIQYAIKRLNTISNN